MTDPLQRAEHQMVPSPDRIAARIFNSLKQWAATPDPSTVGPLSRRIAVGMHKMYAEAWGHEIYDQLLEMDALDEREVEREERVRDWHSAEHTEGWAVCGHPVCRIFNQPE